MRHRLLVSSLIYFFLCWSAFPAWAVNPTLPLSTFNPVLASAAVRTPCPNLVGGLQVCNTVAEVTTALAAGACGDWILLNHLNTFSAVHWSPPTGLNCTNNNYLRITSDAYASLPANTKGYRAQPSEKTSMPTIVIAAGVNGCVDAFTAGTAWIWVDFINCQALAAGNTGGGMNFAVAFPPGTGGSSDMNHIVVDHVFIQGDPTNGMTRGIQLSGANLAITNSVVTNNWDPSNGESQSIAYNGSGPFTIRNNEACAASENINSGDSSVTYWTGGSFGSGSPVIPSDATIVKNYDHKYCLPVAIQGQSKNLLEQKQGQRTFIDSNIFDLAYQAAQQLCIQFVSLRGSNGAASDQTFTNNWVRNCPLGMGMTLRPAEAINVSGAVSDGGTGCSGGPCIKLTLVGPCDCTTGDGVEVASVGGVTDANGTWAPVTRTDSTHVVLPKAWSGLQTYTSGGVVQFWFQGTPLQRVLIKNNLWTNIAGPCCSDATHFWPFIQVNVNPILVFTGGKTDAQLSTTGDWKPHDIQVVHNTMVNPLSGSHITVGGLRLIQPATLFGPYTQYQGLRFIFRDNVLHLNTNASGSRSVTFTSPTEYGTTGLNELSDSATRDFSHNVGYEEALSDDSTFFTGSDTWITLSTTGCSIVVFVSCTIDSIAAAVLQATSPGHLAASDGTDIGINATTLAIALDGVQTGIPSKAMVGGTGNVGGTLNIGQ